MALISRFLLNGGINTYATVSETDLLLQAAISHPFAIPCAGPGDTVGTKFLPGAGLAGRSKIAPLPEHSIVTTGQLSVSFWMRPDVTNFVGQGAGSDYCWVLGKLGSGQNEWGIRYYSHDSADRPGHISCYAYNRDGGLGSGKRRAVTHTVGEWHHVCAVYDLINDVISLYVDGVAGASGEGIFEYQGTRIYPRESPGQIHLGGSVNGADFVGALADLQFYDTALTLAEAQAIRTAVIG